MASAVFNSMVLARHASILGTTVVCVSKLSKVLRNEGQGPLISFSDWEMRTLFSYGADNLTQDADIQLANAESYIALPSYLDPTGCLKGLVPYVPAK